MTSMIRVILVLLFNPCIKFFEYKYNHHKYTACNMYNLSIKNKNKYNSCAYFFFFFNSHLIYGLHNELGSKKKNLFILYRSSI